MTYFITNARAIAQCDLHADAYEGGTPPAVLRIYDGSVPADADTALSGNTLLAELTFSNPAFGNAVDSTPGATATASAITDDSSAAATGTASFYRTLTGTALTVLEQGACGTSGEELNLNTLSIVAGATVSATAKTLFQPES